MVLGVQSFSRNAAKALIIIGALGAAFFIATHSVSAAPGINQHMNFQGRLLNSQGATVPDGYYNIQFKIYQDGDGQTVGNTTGSPAGSLKWTESHLNSAGKGVQVKNGFLSVQLGSITPFGTSIDWNQDTLWLSMDVGNTNTTCTPFASCSPDGEMVPMKRMSSTPYALNAGLLGGKSSANFLQLAQGVQTDASTNTSSIFINKTSTGNLVQLQSGGVDVFSVSNAGDIVFGNTSNHSLSIATSAASTAGRELSLTAGAGGSGTGSTGGNLLLQGGAAGGTNGNGGNITINAGAGTGTGAAGIVSIGSSTTSSINLGQNTVLDAGKSLTITGGATGTRPSSPTEGMVYYDSTTDQLLTYANGKWKADGKRSILVAAANSTQAQKDAADYVATGSGDQAVINTALGASAGGSVYLFEGTYVVNGSISIPNNTSLSGSGAGSVITLPNAFNASINIITNSDTATGTGVNISNLRLEGNSGNQSSGTMRGIYMDRMGSGSGASAVRGATIQNVIANSFGIASSAGIALNISSYNKLVANTVSTNVSAGISITGGSSNTVVGNVVQGNGTYGIVLVASANSNTLSGNILEGNSNGIYLISSNNFNSITANNFKANTARGVAISGGESNTISGNNFSDTGSTTSNNAVYINNSDANLVSNNSITDSSATTDNYAIHISDAGSDRTYLSDNTLGTGTINNAGTNTVFGGQVNSSGNYLVQPAGTIELMKNTTVQSGTLTVGTSSTAGSLVISDGSTNTATIAVGDLGGNYTYTIPVTTASDIFCLQTLGNCTSSGITAVGAYSTTNTAADGATIVGNSIVFQNASASAPGMVGTGTQTFAGDKTFTGNLTISDVTFNAASDHSIAMTTAAAGIAGRSLTVAAGTGGTGAGALAGGNLNLQGGTAGGTNSNGGDLNLTGGNGNGTGTKGLVNIGPSAHTTVTNASCAVDCTILQSNVNNYGTIIVSATTSDIVITLPPPTNTTTQGRTIYVTTSPTSQDFTLRTNSGADIIDVAMRKNTTSTMIWNGTAWTPGGASNATTLQATYNNGSNPATTPEIKLDSIRGTIDIQDADTTIGADILNVRGSNSGGLGTVLFGVSNTGRVTIQGTSDQYSAFRVLNSTGDYLFNINSNNNYVISNAIRSAGNEIDNPGFESGGSITGGEEGWFGPATVSIAENTTDARTGNNALAITASTANIDAFAGSYYEINPGESLYLSGWVKNTVGANGNAGIQITWYDKALSAISSSTAYSNTPGTTYVQRNVGATAPAGTVYARVSATVRSTATTGTFYFDDFYMKRNLESADMTFKNATNSTTAFRIQSAGASNTLFTADTATNAVRIGDSTGSGTDTSILVVDSATADPTALTGLNGGIFYRSDSGSLKAIVGGAVVDICTTAVTCTGYSASAGSTIQLQGTTPGTAQTGNFNITGTGILTALKTQDNAGGSSQALTMKTGDAGAGNSGNLTIDTGSATGTRGSITLGTGNVPVTMGGNLTIQGSNTSSDTLSLGLGGSNNGSILFRSSGGSNTITLRAPTSNPTSSYSLALPTGPGASGECIKTDASGNMFFQGCGVGIAFNLQDAYNNSSTPANIALADGKNFEITATDTLNDPSIIMRLSCTVSCTGTNGRFIVKNSTTDIFSVLPSGGIVLNGQTDIGSGDSTDATATLFQMDNYSGSADNGVINCTQTANAGALYYNTSMGSIRGCINGSWNDISNPDTLGLLTFGVVPSSGSHPYDLPSLITPGYTGPCRASWSNQNQIHIEPCTAYSNGRRVTVNATNLSTNSAVAPHINLTTAAPWGHICLDETTGQPEFTTTAGQSTAANGLPNFSASQPILCIADVKGSTTTAGIIDDLYDVRTFTSAMKEAVNTTTAVHLGMLADSSTSGGLVPATNGSAKLYGAVVATNGLTSSGDPNTIVTTVGPAWIKGVTGGVGTNLGQAGTFVITSTTAGFAYTNSSIPNNSFYYSAGNTRTSFSTTCTAASNCRSSFYVNLIVR